jgi:hypothetical protein
MKFAVLMWTEVILLAGTIQFLIFAPKAMLFMLS